MRKFLTQPATIRKADIAKYAAMQGKANRYSFVVNEQRYSPGTLRFVTFAGSHTANGLYCGVYQFERGDFHDAESVDFSALPKYEPASYETLSDSEAI